MYYLVFFFILYYDVYVFTSLDSLLHYAAMLRKLTAHCSNMAY